MAPPGARGLYAAFPLLDGRQTHACLSSMLRAWHFSLCTSIIKPMFPGLLQEAGGSLPRGLSASVLDREVSAQRTMAVHARKRGSQHPGMPNRSEINSRKRFTRKGHAPT